MIFNKFFRKTNITKGIFLINFEDKDTQPENRFFSDIHLYHDLKQLLSRMFVSKESIHCVLVGPPASGYQRKGTWLQVVVGTWLQVVVGTRLQCGDIVQQLKSAAFAAELIDNKKMFIIAWEPSMTDPDTQCIVVNLEMR
jgi:hypothetical protein